MTSKDYLKRWSEIYEMRKEDVSYREIGEKFGISGARANQIYRSEDRRRKLAARLMRIDPITLLGDALFALEDTGAYPDLCERIREVLKAQGTQSSNVERGSIFDDMPF